MGAVVSVLAGDITRCAAGALVTTPDKSFQVDGPAPDPKVHSEASPKLRKVLLENWPNGGVVQKSYPTLPYELEWCNSDFHAVGPYYRIAKATKDLTEIAQAEHDLHLTYLNALQLCVRDGWETIVFPLISVGKYGFPSKQACRIALKTIRDFLATEGLGDIIRLMIMIPEKDAGGNDQIYADVFP